MEELQRVDIKLSKEVLRWAAVEAAKVGLSRRRFLSEIIETVELKSRTDWVLKYPFNFGDVNIVNLIKPLEKPKSE